MDPLDHTPSFCIFCGGEIPQSSVYNKRKRTLTNLAQFVSTRCHPTPYGYQYFSTAKGDDKVMLCISCVNWQRRSSMRGKSGRKPLLLMDQVALFMMEPGTTPFPDQRCVLRLVMSLRKCDSWVPKLLLGLMPVPVQTMIAMLPERLEGSILNAIVKVWWDYNGKTSFLTHHLTAKLVRKMLKHANAETV
jgi:hypothetical protein